MNIACSSFFVKITKGVVMYLYVYYNVDVMSVSFILYGVCTVHTQTGLHLSSNSYNFRMQPNIAMKFAGYVA